MNTSVQLIGTYTVTAAASPTDAQKEALKNSSYTINLEPLSNVVILNAASGLDLTAGADDDEKAANVAAAKSVATSGITAVVSFDANGDIVEACTVAKPYYMVRTNNPNGNEYISTGTNGTLVENNWTQGVYAAGATALYSSKVYQANGATTAGDAWAVGTTGATWKLIDHLEDKIQVVAGQTNVSKNP